MKKTGFTLAEVLITLVIIGVIAAMTVPTLMNNTQGQEYKSALKKAISAANQALTLHYALEGEGAQDSSDNQALAQNVFKSHMSIMGGKTDTLAFPVATGATQACSGSGTTATWATADGIIYCIATDFTKGDDAASPLTAKCNSSNTVPCGTDTSAQMFFDVNGEKKPNKLTTNANAPKDQYQAQIYNQKVVPFGNPTQQVMYDKERKDAPTS